MRAAVFRDTSGPARIWLLDGSEVPPTAAVPSDTSSAIAVWNSKGSQPSWEQWAATLASRPGMGNWVTEDVPDGMNAAQVLGYVRWRDLRSNAGGMTAPA